MCAGVMDMLHTVEKKRPPLEPDLLSMAHTDLRGI